MYLSALLLIWTLVEFVNVNYIVANLFALAVLLPIGHYSQRRLTFNSHAAIGPERSRYAIHQVMGIIFALSAITFLVEILGLWYVTANVVVTCIQVLAQFIFADRWVFGANRSQSATQKMGQPSVDE